jgi:ketosteroid isomerase-like protein
MSIKPPKIKALLSILALLMAFAPNSYGQASSAIGQAVIKLEQERVEALLKGDLATVERIFADDLIYTHSNARVETKQQFLDAVKSGLTKYEGVKHSDLKAQVFGDTVVLRGKSDLKGAFNGQPFTLQIRFLTVYVKINNRWQMTVWQSTRLPSP